MNDKKKEENKFKEVWSNRRYRALILLSFYVTFFIVIGTIFDFNVSTSNLDNKIDTNEKTTDLFSMDNYDFYYNITYLGEADEPLKYENIEGFRYQTKSVIELRNTNESYYMENGKIYKIGKELIPVSNPFLLDFEKLEPAFIRSYIEKGRLDSKTEYADGTLKKIYFIPVQVFAQLYMEEDVPLEGNVLVTTFEKGHNINKVEMDLTLYNKMKFELNYKQIGKVKNFYREDLTLKQS